MNADGSVKTFKALEETIAAIKLSIATEVMVALLTAQMPHLTVPGKT
jgi:hypothetical protein